MPAEVHDPIVEGHPPQHHRAAGDQRPLAPPAEELFADYPDDAIQIAGKTGTAQGAGSYPWNDSSVFTAFSLDPTHPYTVIVVPREGGLRLAGAAPVVKCMFLALSGMLPIDPVVLSEPLDTTPASRAAEDAADRSHVDCMASATPTPMTPGAATGAKD